MSVPLPPSPAGPAYPVPPPGYALPGPRTPLLPRRAALALTLLLLPLLAFVFFAPLVLLIAGDSRPSPAHIWMHFKEGGWGMWAITLSQMILCPVFLALGALMIRGKRVPAAILFILALLPFLASILSTLQSMQMITGAISGESVDASQKARILAMGISELSNVTIYGGVAAGVAMYAAAVIAVHSLIAIDTAPLAPAAKSVAWIIPLPAAVGAAIVAGVLRAVVHVSFSVLDVLVIFGLLTAGLLAALGGKPLPSLVAGRNDDEAGPAFRLLVLAAIATAAAMYFVDRAASAVEPRVALGAIAGESVDAHQRVRILLEAVVPSYRGRPIIMAVDALLCLGVFAAPIVSGLGAKQKFSAAAIAGGVVGALVALLALLAGSRTDASVAAQREPFAKAEKALADSGVAVPTIRLTEGTTMLSGDVQMFVKSDGTVVSERAPSERASSAEYDDGPSSISVAADGALPFELFMSKAAPALPGRGGARIGLLVTPAERLDLAPLGPLAGLVGTNLLVYSMALNVKLADGLKPPRPRYSWSEPRSGASKKVLAVLPKGDAARLLVLSSSSKLMEVEASLADTLPLGDPSRAQEDRRRVLSSIRSARPAIGTILLAPAAGATMAQVVAQLEAIASALSRSDADLALTGDRAALDQAAEMGPSGRVKMLTREVTVLGSLPKELVERPLRQNATSLTTCYKSAKGGDGADVPKEVTVRFVIDGSGSASKVTATTGKSRAFGLCVESAIGKIAFPAPDRGLVSVTAKLLFD